MAKACGLTESKLCSEGFGFESHSKLVGNGAKFILGSIFASWFKVQLIKRNIAITVKKTQQKIENMIIWQTKKGSRQNVKF